MGNFLFSLSYIINTLLHAQIIISNNYTHGNISGDGDKQIKTGALGYKLTS